MITVHLWLTSSEGVGHASLTISATREEPELHVSYWPGGVGADAKKDFKLKQTTD
jgi:hypothetical protein